MLLVKSFQNFNLWKLEFSQVVWKRRSKVQNSFASRKEQKLASGSVSRNVQSHEGSKFQSLKAEILAALTLAKFRGRCYCEKEISQVLGNSPDTSKALNK